MRIAILAPIQNSLFSRLIAYLAQQEPDIEVTQIVVRSIWSWSRIKGELRRDGIRLMNKIYKKLILGGQAYKGHQGRTILDMAQALNLPGRTLGNIANQFEIPILTVNDHNDEKSITALSSAEPDLILFTGGGLLRKKLLDIPKIGVVNCHAGLLPHYRGMDVIEWAIMEAGDDSPQTGLTLHYMDRGVDTGPILKTHSLDLIAGETIDDFRIRVEPEMVELVMNGIREIRDGRLKAKPQKKSDGKQYFVMHPRVKKVVEDKIQRGARKSKTTE